MSDWTPLTAHPATGPEEEAAREARHQLLIDLLGGYLDAELPAETRAQIDAHLVGCARCRRELRLQREVRHMLGAEPPMAASPLLHDRIVAAVAAAPAPDPATIGQRPTTLRRWIAVGAIGLLLAGALATAGVMRASRDTTVPRRTDVSARPLDTPPAQVPLLAGVLADYRRATAGELPGRARDLESVRAAMPFSVEPLRVPALRLVGAWTTNIGGEAAAVLAYRVDDHVILEYLVSEEWFFRHPAVRRAVTGGRLISATDGGQRVIAWPASDAGAILVGEVSAEAMTRLAMEDRLARRGARSAE